MTRTDDAALRRKVRLLELHAALSTLVILLLLVAAFAPRRADVLDVLDVKRINVLDDAGTPALVLASVGRLPGPTFEGKEYPQELSGGRTTSAGMIFFNQRGDEVGGLVFGGNLTEDGYQAGGSLTFDQFHQDQVVGMQYADDGTHRSAGYHVWDRSTDVSIARILDLVDARRTATGAARDSLERVIGELASGGLGAHRVFLGSRDRTATLGLQDPSGNVRLRLTVDSLGTPRIEFLDEGGTVVRSLPQ
jgi:hypothetical protein